jgi:hypothetical protein
MTMRKPWKASENVLWFVVGENGSLWLSTASFTKRGSLQAWQDDQPDGGRPWRYWYRNGFRCRRVKIRYQIQ